MGHCILVDHYFGSRFKKYSHKGEILSIFSKTNMIIQLRLVFEIRKEPKDINVESDVLIHLSPFTQIETNVSENRFGR